MVAWVPCPHPIAHTNTTPHHPSPRVMSCLFSSVFVVLFCVLRYLVGWCTALFHFLHLGLRRQELLTKEGVRLLRRVQLLCFRVQIRLRLFQVRLQAWSRA